jgi:hypothetical protein
MKKMLLVLLLSPFCSIAQVSISNFYVTGKVTKVSVSNSFGQTVFSRGYDSVTADVRIADLPKGMYIVKVNGAVAGKVASTGAVQFHVGPGGPVGICRVVYR